MLFRSIVLDESKTKAEKFNQVLEIGTGYFGLAEAGAKTTAGQYQQFKNSLGDVYETMAFKFLPIMNIGMGKLKSLLDTMNEKAAFNSVKEAIIGQRVEFERLVMVYKDLHFNQNRSKEQNEKYARTISDLMSKYPNYLGKINLEKDNWDTISKRLEKARSQQIGRASV